MVWANTVRVKHGRVGSQGERKILKQPRQGYRPSLTTDGIVRAEARVFQPERSHVGWHAQVQLERVFLCDGTYPSKHGQTSLAVPPGSTITLWLCAPLGKGMQKMRHCRFGPGPPA